MQRRLAAVAAELPGRHVGELLVVTQRLTLLGLRLGAEVASARLATVEGVDAHQLTELDEVGDAAGLLERLVEAVGGAEHLEVRPEVRLELADHVDGPITDVVGEVVVVGIGVGVHRLVVRHQPVRLVEAQLVAVLVNLWKE